MKQNPYNQVSYLAKVTSEIQNFLGNKIHTILPHDISSSTQIGSIETFGLLGYFALECIETFLVQKV